MADDVLYQKSVSNRVENDLIWIGENKSYSDQYEDPKTRIQIKPDKLQSLINVLLWIFDQKEVKMSSCLRLEF